MVCLNKIYPLFGCDVLGGVLFANPGYRFFRRGCLWCVLLVPVSIVLVSLVIRFAHWYLPCRIEIILDVLGRVWLHVELDAPMLAKQHCSKSRCESHGTKKLSFTALNVVSAKQSFLALCPVADMNARYE